MLANQSKHAEENDKETQCEPKDFEVREEKKESESDKAPDAPAPPGRGPPRGPPTGPPARGAPRGPPTGPPGRGEPRGPPTGPPGRGAPRGPPTGPPGRGGGRGPPTGPPGRGAPSGPPGLNDSNAVSVPMAPAGRGRGPAARGPVGRGGPAGRGRGGASAIQPTKKEIIPKKKMKNLVWKRILLDPAKAQQPLIWRKIKEEKVDQDEIEDRFSQVVRQKKANESEDAQAAGTVVVKGPIKKTFFTDKEF